MKHTIYFIVFSLLSASLLHAQQTKSPQVMSAFRDVIAKPREGTVRIVSRSKDAALGVVLSADGWILSKHSTLDDGDLVCKLHDGREFEAKRVAHDEPFDLVLLKIEASDLTPLELVDSKTSRVGHWVAAPGTGQTPVAIGVLSVASREIKGAAALVKPSGAFLGVTLDVDFAGAKIEGVQPGGPAAKAGLKADDQILSVDGREMESAEELVGLIAKLKPGVEVALKVQRGDEKLDIKATLGGRPPATTGGKSRQEMQNNLGSKLSARRTGFPVILQHDSVLSPTDCGGPLVNLRGQVIGVNISRAGRTESYAIPSEAVRPLIERLKRAATDSTTP